MSNTVEHLAGWLVEICDEHQHRHERLPGHFIRTCIKEGSDGIGLLAFAIGVCNMGVDFEPVYLIDGTILRPSIADPALDQWKGRPPGHGKHLNDYKRGGLLGPHIDGPSLRDVYARWGNPGLPPQAPICSFNRVIKSQWGPKWLDWAEELTERPEVQTWAVMWWIKKFWNHHLVVCDDIAKRIVRSRIANSRPGWLRTIPVTDTIRQHRDTYSARKYREGFEDAKRDGLGKVQCELRGREKENRAEHQMSYVRRVLALLEMYGGGE